MRALPGVRVTANLQHPNLLPIDEALAIATAVAGALDYAHKHGVIHRDLKRSATETTTASGFDEDVFETDIRVITIILERYCMNARIQAIAICLVAAALAGCGGGESATASTPSPTVASVSVSAVSGALQVGATTTLIAVVRDNLGNSMASKPISWSSSATSVATVGASTGVVTAVSAGTATVTASVDGVTGSTIVTVAGPVSVATVLLSIPAAPLAIGSSIQTNITLRDAAGNTLGSRPLTWASSNSSVATVSASGLVSAVSGGTAVISATVEGKVGSAPVTVTPGTLTIRAGGTYSGLWASSDPKTPAVTVLTTDPVVIENCTIRSKGELIQATANLAHLTIRNCSGYGEDPGIAGTLRGDFLFGFKIGSLVMEHNSMEGVAYGAKLYGGGTTPDGPIVIRYNRAHNLDGVPSNGRGGRDIANPGYNPDSHNHFVILTNTLGVVGGEIAWNESTINPDSGSMGDHINIYASSGTAASPLQVHDNFISGQYAPVVEATGGTGSGITTDGTASDLATTATAFVKIHDNQVVSGGNVGISIAAGHDNEIFSNRVVSTGQLADGRWFASRFGQGINVWNCTCYNQPATTFFNNFAHDNVVGYRKENADPANNDVRVGPPVRADYFLPGCQGGASGGASKCTNNQSLPDPITATIEANELAFWNQKLAANGIRIGSSP